GLLLGIILYAGGLLFNLCLTPAITAALILLLHFLLTGGFHLDGIADTADGLMSGKVEPEKIFAIMKDSFLGSMGATALILLLLLKFSALLTIVKDLPAALIIFPIFGRYAIIQLTFSSEYARPEGGLGATFTNHCGQRELLIAAATSLLSGLIFAGFAGLLSFFGVVLYVIIINYAARRKFNGVTGDILGFACESSEALALVLLVASI
ncbi:MAG: adenosylcobinamide-GDP ribazoletransferase, partial [Deltaproteobacteria bacterium]|nr:adenosylcobinamide-GDP ribazoletransferase [Deltaproteobacteria bacterium]